MVGITAAWRIVILVFYFLFICFLFFLPGDALPPTAPWFGAIYFDKIVHFGIFSILTFLLCWTIGAPFSKTVAIIFFGAVLYGILVEVIQDQLVINRSFDLTDWAADIVGSIAGTGVWLGRYAKK
jgi:VanZ family protein